MKHRIPGTNSLNSIVNMSIRIIIAHHISIYQEALHLDEVTCIHWSMHLLEPPQSTIWIINNAVYTMQKWQMYSLREEF